MRHSALRPYAKTEVTSGWKHAARPYSTHQTERRRHGRLQSAPKRPSRALALLGWRLEHVSTCVALHSAGVWRV